MPRKEKRTVRFSASVDLPADRTDWTRVRRLTDGRVAAAAARDPDAAPPLDAAWFSRARVVLPQAKADVHIKLDRDIIDWFKRQSIGGRGYQTRINALLRAYVDAQQRRSQTRQKPARRAAA